MRFTSKMIAWTTACLLALPAIAVAEESVEAQLQELNARMEQMEGQLAEAEAQVAAQEEVIEQSEDRRGSNALSSFIEATEIDSWVAASYNVNFNDPSKSGAAAGVSNQGSFGGLYEPFFPVSNTFQLDQAWISINKAPTEESRAGYNLDIAAGAGSNGTAGGATNALTGMSVYSAYVSYMMPIMDGFTFSGGIMPTAQGAEVVQTTMNLNVTRGIQWGTQPVTNTGFTGTLDMGGGLTAMIGMTNNPTVLELQDPNNPKGLTSRLNYSADKFSIGAGVNYGKAATNGTGTGAPLANKVVLLNVLASIDPTENLTAYVDYTLNHWTGPDADVHAISVATRLAVLDTTGIAVRGEVIIDDDGLFSSGAGGNLWSVTGTIDHALTDNLTGNLEVRYDGVADSVTGSGNGFWNGAGTATSEGSQVLLLAQLVYQF
jgi:hypothetical protein